MLKKIKLNYAPHTYLAKTKAGKYLISIIIPVEKGKTAELIDIVYSDRVRITLKIIDDVNSTMDYVMRAFPLKAFKGYNSKVEVIVKGAITYIACDTYREADQHDFNLVEGVAYNCPHLFLGRNRNGYFYPKGIVPLKGYDLVDSTDAEFFKLNNDSLVSYEYTLRLRPEASIKKILLSPKLNTQSYRKKNAVKGITKLSIHLIEDVKVIAEGEPSYETGTSKKEKDNTDDKGIRKRTIKKKNRDA